MWGSGRGGPIVGVDGGKGRGGLFGGDPMWTQAPGGGWYPAGVEVVGRSLDGSAVQAALASGEGPCSVVWWVFWGVGGSWVTNWRVGLVERTGRWGREWPGGVPVETSTVGRILGCLVGSQLEYFAPKSMKMRKLQQCVGIEVGPDWEPRGISQG